MSIATYSDLQSAVAARLHRDDLTSVIQDCISLTEAELQLRFRLLENEVTTNIVVTSGVGTLPSDFQGSRSVYWSGSTVYELEYITPELFDARQNITADVPTYYTVTGSSIKVSPSSTGTAVLTYFGKFTALSNGNPTNSIMTNAPDVYLYGTLHHCSIYTKDDTDIQKYAALYSAAIDRVLDQDQARRFTSQLAVRPR